jgi:hypothetical protein
VSLAILCAPFDASTLPTRNGALDPDGYIYAVEFSLGIVKVGRTNNPRARLYQHEKTVCCFGGSVTRAWFSSAHRNWRENERILLEHAGRLGERLAETEYFRGCDFDAVLEGLDWLSFAETPAPQRGSAPSKAEAELLARVRERREAGWPMRKVAADLEVSLSTVQRAIRTMGMPARAERTAGSVFI